MRLMSVASAWVQGRAGIASLIGRSLAVQGPRLLGMMRDAHGPDQSTMGGRDMIRTTRFASVLSVAGLIGLGLMGCPPPSATSARGQDAAAVRREPMFEGLGSYRRAVSTNSPEAQRYFDQGLNLLFAFNHDEAARSFQ